MLFWVTASCRLFGRCRQENHATPVFITYVNRLTNGNARFVACELIDYFLFFKGNITVLRCRLV